MLPNSNALDPASSIKDDLRCSKTAILALSDGSHFGVAFTYWPSRASASRVLIRAKYANLKQEMLSNTVCRLSRVDWDSVQMSAQLYGSTRLAKQMRADLSGDEARMYGIADGARCEICHIQSLLLFANYADTAHKHLTRAHLRFDAELGREVDAETVAARHSEYANWARMLRECVAVFGAAMRRTSAFYHALSRKATLGDLRVRFEYPLSVTSEASIATHFVARKGVIAQLRRRESEMMAAPRFVSCAWLSDAEYEREAVLCFVGATRLSVTAIFEVATSLSYRAHLRGVEALNQLINGKPINALELDANANANALRRLDALLRVRLSERPRLRLSYIDRVFGAFCSRQDNVIKLDLKFVTSTASLRQIAPHFVDLCAGQNCVRIAALIALFPNAKAFEIKCPELNAKTFDALLRLLDDAALQRWDAQTQRITFKWVERGIDHIVDAFAHRFAERAWTMQKKNKYGFVYLSLCSDEWVASPTASPR